MKVNKNHIYFLSLSYDKNILSSCNISLIPDDSACMAYQHFYLGVQLSSLFLAHPLDIELSLYVHAVETLYKTRWSSTFFIKVTRSGCMSVFMSLQKDISFCWIDMVLLCNVVFHTFWKGLLLFLWREPPSISMPKLWLNTTISFFYLKIGTRIHYLNHAIFLSVEMNFPVS